MYIVDAVFLNCSSSKVQGLLLRFHGALHSQFSVRCLWSRYKVVYTNNGHPPVIEKRYLPGINVPIMAMINSTEYSRILPHLFLVEQSG